MEQSDSVKVNCDFCGKEIECPKNMLEKSKKHMCHECFFEKARNGSDEPLEDVHVDFPTNELIPEVADKMTDEMTQEIFPIVWEKNKKELKEMSKKELAYEMFGAGAYIALSNLLELQYQKGLKGKKRENFINKSK